MNSAFAIPHSALGMELWEIAGWIGLSSACCALGLAIWIWIDVRRARRRLSKMREQTDEKRQALGAAGQNGSSL